MRYEARAYGTRDEIIEQLRARLGPAGSKRREAEALAAIEALEAGADTVVAGKIHYFVVDTAEPLSPAADGFATARGTVEEDAKQG